MKLETFFEKFELFAEAPNSLERMRELILELAVRGKLLEQEDHPPSGMESIDSEKKKKIPTKTESGIESLFSIPQSWEWTKLASLGDMNPRNSVRDLEKSSFVPMALISAEYGKKNSQQERLWGEIKKGYTHFMNGDVVMAKITPCFENGKSCVMSGLTGGIGAGTTELHVFRPEKSKAIPEYVIIYLKTRGFIERGIPKMTGSAGQKRIPSSYFLESPFPLPPLTEQKRIVAKVNDLMAFCDRLEAQQQERDAQRAKLARASLARFAEEPTPTNLSSLFHPSYNITPVDLRKSILALAVQGKLVHQDPNDELAEELIARISTMRRIKNSREYAQIDADETPYDIPPSWSWVRLGNICLSSDSGWSPQCLPEARSGTDWGVLKVSAVSWGVYKPEENKALPAGMTSRPDCEVKAGDFLLSRANTEELVARSVVVDETPPRLMMSDKIVRFTFPNEIERAFVNLANTSEPSRAYYARNASGTSSSMKNIGREVMCNLPIPLPPIAEQRRIVARVEELMAVIDQLEVQIEKAKKTSAALLDTAIHELLNPREAAVDRTGIGCHVVHMLADRKTFGRTALAKFAYLAETHVGLPFNGQYLREAAGPLDPWIYRFEEEAARERWFTFENTSIRDGNRKIVYRKGAELEVKASAAFAALPQTQRDELDRVLALLGGKPTEEVEIIATLFAVWNDSLIDGHSPSDENIVTGFREHWHEKKQKFAAKSLHVWLDWMRRNGLVPTGRGPRTQQHPTLDLH